MNPNGTIILDIANRGFDAVLCRALYPDRRFFETD